MGDGRGRWKRYCLLLGPPMADDETTTTITITTAPCGCPPSRDAKPPSKQTNLARETLTRPGLDVVLPPPRCLHTIKTAWIILLVRAKPLCE